MVTKSTGASIRSIPYYRYVEKNHKSIKLTDDVAKSCNGMANSVDLINQLIKAQLYPDLNYLLFVRIFKVKTL